MPTASLPTLEHRLEACLLELDKLHRERPHLPTAMARAEAGERIDELLDAIAELQRMCCHTVDNGLRMTTLR